MILRFALRSSAPEDENRVFIVTFYKADRTVVVREPPKRNSGIMGGNFLSRMKVNRINSQCTAPQKDTTRNFTLRVKSLSNGAFFSDFLNSFPRNDFFPDVSEKKW